MFTHPIKGEKINREGNVYFHANVKCIRMKQPFFHPNCVKVASLIMPQLTSQHILYLKTIWHAYSKIQSLT